VPTFMTRIMPTLSATTEPRPRRTLLRAALVVGLAVALTGMTAIQPASALSVNKFTTRCDGVSLRTKPSTSATRKATIHAGLTVIVVARVTGGSWRTNCAGKVTSGNTWYKISNVAYKSSLQRYGVSYVYAATSLFKWVSSSTYLSTSCDGTILRTSASTSATRKTTLSAGTVVVSSKLVSGGSWSTSCSGSTVSGSTWYRIKTIGSKSVSSLYGTTYLYAAKGLFAPLSTTSNSQPSTAPSPTPTPKPTPSPTPTPTPSPSSSYIEGIDVSHWQGTIDWAKVKGTGKKFTFIKASESTDFVDDHYATNRAQAKANGLKVGAYHFARPDTTAGDAVAEADHFVDTAVPASGELLPVLDLEVSGGLTDAQLQAWVQAFMDRVYERTGVKGAIYTSPSFWSNYVGNTQALAAGGYKTLWVAHWTSNTAPTVPAGNWGGNGWTFWQYTSDGTVAGISGRVDLDRYRFTDWTKVTIP
jgi:GH25 family lysozyme M1 (1,4-beta-N-acetylmuramidase)